MEKAVQTPPSFEEDGSFSCTKKLIFEGSPASEDTEYSPFIDSGYKLPLYLSEFALGEFNSKKKASYEIVNVVKTMKSLDAVKGATYLITFEAYSPEDNSNYAKTFETNIFMSPLDPTAKIEIKFVRIKGSECDHIVKEDSEQTVSESDEENFEEKVSQFDKNDNEEKLSEFDEEDTEEKVSQFDKNDNEEMLSESGEEDTKEQISEFDGKDSAEEKLPKSDERDIKENLNGYDEKDSEKKLSEFAGKYSVEEKVSEFNVQNSAKEMFAEYRDKNFVEEKLFESKKENFEEGKMIELNGEEYELWKSDDEYKEGSEYSKEIKQMDVETRNESDEEDYKLSDSDDEYKEGSEYSKEIKQYRMDVEKSDGFDIGYYPHVNGSCCMLCRYYDPPAKTLSAAFLNELVYLSQLAICVYNMKEGTYYDNVRVIKAVRSGCGGTNYNITFEASLSDGNAVTFQTRLYASLPFPYQQIEIDLVRIKASIIPDITN